MNRLVVILVALVVMFFIFSGIILYQTNDEVADLVFYDVKMSNVEDGVYQGSANITLVKAEVEIEVKQGKIIRFDIKRHDHGLGQKAKKIENLIKDEVLNAKPHDEDAVTGATVSYTVIKSAVSDALNKGMKE